MAGTQGWDGYYNAQSDDSMSGIGSLGDLNCGTSSASCPYVPDLNPVGSGSAYFPRSVDNDAAALNFLGFGAGFPGGGVSQASDMANAEGAWDSTFQDAVRHFQANNGGLTVDGWIGPNTRKALAAAVNAQNARPRSPNALPNPPAPPAPAIPGLPAIVPVAPAAPAKPAAPGAAAPGFLASLTTTQKVLAALGVAAVLGGGYYLLK